jgi:HSP20 family protein
MEPETKIPAAQAPAAASPFDTLQREVDRLFDAFHPVGSWQPSRWPSSEPTAPRPEAWQAAPAMNMVETDAGFELTAELPGLDERDVEITLSNGNLTIRGEKKEERKEQRGAYHLSERRFGAFHRSFRIPEGVDADSIEASLGKGVLTLTMPKSPTAKPSERRIDVKAA